MMANERERERDTFVHESTMSKQRRKDIEILEQVYDREKCERRT